MGAFDLPTGDFELLLKGKDGTNWQSVMFTDRLDYETIVGCVEDWNKNYEVLGARFNGRAVTIPEKFHWELRYKDEVFGSFKTRAEAVELMKERKAKQREDKTVKIGLPKFVLD